MKYEETIAYLFDLQKHGMKLGLDNIRKLLAEFGNPHTTFRSIHIAGTNGKGSTSAMIESMLRTAGIRTGLFTSPHLVSFTERIRVNGREIPEADVVALAAEVRSAAERIPDFSPTFFEVTTALAFLYFRSMHVDWAVVEVGMGGRLDATNVLAPEISVITPIGLDHQEFLGSTLREIAAEKAGIIKRGIPVVAASQHPEAMEIVRGRTAERNAALFLYGEDFRTTVTAEDLTGITIDYVGAGELRGLAVGLAGRHQAVNAALALKVMEVVMTKHPGLACDVKRGLRDVCWPGRLEFVKDHPPVLMDGAHNPPAAEVLAGYLRTALNLYSRIILVMGIMGDKDREGIMKPLLPLASEIVLAAPSYGRAASAEALAAEARTLGWFPKTAASVSEALVMAENLYLPGDLIVVTGSFYMIGEAKEVYGSRGVLARLRE